MEIALRSGFPRAITVLAGLVLLAAVADRPRAQPQVSREMVSFKAATLRDPGAEVRGELQIPQTGGGALPSLARTGARRRRSP